MEKKLKEIFFDATTEKPGSWLMEAMQLKVAAERIDWLFNPTTEEEQSLSLMSVYRFLMGLSFENLIKGILHAEGHKVIENGKFTTLFSKHDLKYLANEFDISKINISEDEKNTLNNITPYIFWAGRYPLPKHKNDIIAKDHGRTEHQHEIALWEKLAEYLASISSKPGQQP